MAQRFTIRLTGGVALNGQVKRPGDTVTVDEKIARDLLRRGKGILTDQVEQESAEKSEEDLNALTVAQLRERVPDAPARATKGELIALIEGVADEGG